MVVTHTSQEKHIRTHQSVKSVALVTQSYKVVGKQVARSSKKVTKKLKKRIIRYGLFGLNTVILIAVVAIIFKNPTSSTAVKQGSLNQESGTAVVANPLDELSSADIALQVARITRLPEATSVQNNADTQGEQLSIVASGSQTVTKPQIVSTTLKSKKDIKIHTVKEGETITSLATQFGVTSDSIKWSNGISSDALAAGKKLYIPPVNGVVHEVVRGDTPDSLATKYKANKEQIIADNDAEVAGLKLGDRVLVRDGSIAPPVVRYSAVAYNGFAWGGTSPVYNAGGYNGYDYGYCTWYVANKRAAAGRPIPSNLGNASTWRTLAQRAGFSVGSAPAVGAVIWTPPRDYYGHVGYVEAVNEDGSVLVSEMNVVGWARVSTKTLTAAQAAGYSYIY